jgi:ubiquinone/menaquinone biosynthesis C-methylase UbiE
MNHYIKIYNSKAREYHRMIEAEDADNLLLATLLDIVSFEKKTIFDLGSGTGRLPLLLRDMGSQIIALDLHTEMLREQVRQRNIVKGRWSLLQGDMQRLPFDDQCTDVVLAGWALGHFTGWYPDDWRTRVKLVIGEMQRMTKPGGSIIILETLGTGSLKAAPPHEGLAAYYSILEKQLGFERREVATDYQFESPDAAIQNSEFFFGPELSQKIRDHHWDRIPEWTGIWSKHC